MRFDVITLFPDMVNAAAATGVTGRGLEQGLLALQSWNPRDYTTDVHRTVDDRPYGGGPGMVMKPEPLAATIEAVREVAGKPKVIALSPQGRRFDQTLAQQTIAAKEGLILLCGRYEGIDERLIEAEVDEEWSLGDYVLSGGELGALIIIDVLARLIPGVLGHADSAQEDSFMGDGLLDCPHFTRPPEWEGRAVPAVLQSGDHQAIAKWRREQMLARTTARRPDLLTKNN